MPTVVGVKLRTVPKVLWFDPGEHDPAVNDIVVVETERGTEMGIVAEASHEVEASRLSSALKPVVRMADEEDLARADELVEKEAVALKTFREAVKKHGLDMKPIDAEYLFSGDKLIFYFSAEERVDFRELVRELASEFKTRIDMRQIGVRDEARMIGGLGHCGEQLCCVRFAGDFQPVSIRMAKEQDLPLNPLKISGLCGRLMCCLRYEFDAYKDFKSRAPKRGALVQTPIGEGKVADLNTPRETVTVRVPQAGSMTVPLSAMECCSDKGCPCVIKREALEQAGVSLPVVIAAALDREGGAPERSGKRGDAGSSGRRSGAERAGRPKPEGAASAGDEQQKQAGPSKRSRRSKGGKSKGAQGAQGAQDKRSGSPGDAGSAGGPADAAKAKSSGRRRRRRRPGGGSSGAGSGSGSS